MTKLTLKQAKEMLKTIGYKITKTEYGEYRVCPMAGNKHTQERQANYETDLWFACSTALFEKYRQADRKGDAELLKACDLVSEQLNPYRQH